MIKKREFEELLESACLHVESEFGLENVRPSLRTEFQNLRRAHDAVHEFMFLAPLLIPSATGNEFGWQKSAFLIYHWEAFHHAHRSLCEALCAYYNVAFVLLRVTFELLIKGAFWECLSHKEFRENSQVLDDDKAGGEIKRWLKEIFELAPDVEEGFEQVSASIYDKVDLRIEDREFRPSIKTIVRQLDRWGIFNPVPKAETRIYAGIYSRLSGDVHVAPERTDIGRRLIVETSEVFGQEVLPDTLREYALSLHKVMDLAILIELNIMAGLIGQYEEAKTNLRKRLGTLEQLGLGYSFKRASQLSGLAA